MGGPSGCRCCGDQRTDRQEGAEADRGRLRGSSVRYRRSGSHAAGRSDPARLSAHQGRHRRGCGQADQYRRAQRAEAGQHREGLCRGGRGDRAVIRFQADAPGLYRVAVLHCQYIRRRSGRPVVLYAGALGLSRPFDGDHGYRLIQDQDPAIGTGRRLRRQDDLLYRAAGGGAVAQGQGGRKDDDDARRSAEGHRTGIGHPCEDQDRRQEGRHDRCRAVGIELPDRPLYGFGLRQCPAGDLDALRYRECRNALLRGGLQPPEGGFVPCALRAADHLRRRSGDHRTGAGNRHGRTRFPPQECGGQGSYDNLRAEVR